MMEAEAAAALPKRRLPKGTSDYQAAWILDDYEGEGEEEDEDGAEPDQAAERMTDRDAAEEGTPAAATSEFGDDEPDEMEAGHKLCHATVSDRHLPDWRPLNTIMIF
jgi:pre-rRNA-processing protein TSR1